MLLSTRSPARMDFTKMRQLRSSLRLIDVFVHPLALFKIEGASGLNAMDAGNADFAGATYLSFRAFLAEKPLPFESV